MEIQAENLSNKKQIKIKPLFDQGSQRGYLTKKVQQLLSSKPISTQDFFISTLGNKFSKPTKLYKVSLSRKGFPNQKFEIKPLCTLFICSPIRIQQINFLKTQFEYY